MLQKKRELRVVLLVALTIVCFFVFTHHAFDSTRYPAGDVFSEGRLALADSMATPSLPPASPTPSWKDQLREALGCRDRPLEPERVQYGSFWLARNFVRGSASRRIGCAEAITYTTIGDYTFFDSLPSVVSRWLAPVSFAVFAPGHDFNATMESIQYVRNCLPESELVRQFVTFHVYFPADHMPPYLPLSEAEALCWPYDCNFEAGEVRAPYDDVQREQMYKTQANLTYPINVGRNIARKAANTHFVFACDIELFPSPGFVQRFLQMVARNRSVIGDAEALRVFPLPVFEIQKDVDLPNTKEELRELLDSKQVIPFHQYVCKICHLVPNQTQWLNVTGGDELSVFAVGRREGRFGLWEPFYVSDNREPLFDERVTWEGQKNKRIQGFAMCLMNYEYHILNDGFLVHSPGIKHPQKNSPRLKYVPPMNKLIKHVIEPEYKVLFGQNKKCKV